MTKLKQADAMDKDGEKMMATPDPSATKQPYYDLQQVDKLEFSKNYQKTNCFTRFFYWYGLDIMNTCNSPDYDDLKPCDIVDMNYHPP